VHNFQIQNMTHSLATMQEQKPERQDEKSKHHVQ
jgi:hypothetical protein